MTKLPLSRRPRVSHPSLYVSRVALFVLSGKSVKNQLKYSNNVNAMVSAGSKGSSINICQIIACVMTHRHTRGLRRAAFLCRT